MLVELNPHLSERIWGGTKLLKLKKLAPDKKHLDPIGETWEVSTHPEGISKLKATKESLTQFVKLSYLVKLLDTASVLSVQVHPDDHYAEIHENQKGKNECWLILEVNDGAGIYLGFKPGITKDKLKNALVNKEDISAMLNFIPVKRGDFFFVPAGTIHAIGAGITMVEVQQSSGVTYRVWDWNRVDSKGKSRELHVDKSFDVLVDDPQKNTLKFFRYKENVLSGKQRIEKLAGEIDFNFEVLSLKKNEKEQMQLSPGKTYSFFVLEGQVKVDDIVINPFETYCILNNKGFNFHAVVDTKICIFF
jgi:mannose-6-phosphate isomerase